MYSREASFSLTLRDNMTRKTLLNFTYLSALAFQDHPMLRRAATEVINNLVMSEDVAKRFETDVTERMKLLILYCEEDDFELIRAASGALAHLTLHENNCRRIMTIKQW